MLFGSQKKVAEVANKDWTYILKLVSGKKWSVVEHVNFNDRPILWGTEAECRALFETRTNNMKLTPTK